MARLTGLEPATPGVTGRYSNQLSYNRASTVIADGGTSDYARRRGASSGFRDETCGFSHVTRLDLSLIHISEPTRPY